MRAAVGLLALALAGGVAAQELLGSNATPQQVASGRAVAAGAGGQGQQGACFSCHGFDGAGQQAALFPALAGQSAEYLLLQLDRYASGARRNEVMSPIAAAMTPEQRRDVSVYYAAQPVKAAEASPLGNVMLLQRGGVLSAAGGADVGVQACQNCHGPAGIGIQPLYPRLAGQPAEYLAARLRAWREGEAPAEGASHQAMAAIAKRLSDDDINAVSLYFASVRQAPATPGTGVLR
ncbi:c-type cytochrome [Falsiroseomonas ponticola]|uniref:c-type cytochrome n=1 Tax=Falsiroseomonas ponticola TaxID=2786951 RepID=UPI001933606E|nr:c-type cytochrome [Roseomonas ponticola]